MSATPLTVGYPPRPGDTDPTVLVHTSELAIERGDRVALIGPNGAGKTSLLRTIIGNIPPMHGRIEFGTNVKPAYYAQGHEGLDFNETALGTILKAFPMSEEGAAALLGRFLFSGDDAHKSVSALSGGERSRLALARLTLEQANFRSWIEPTNHLDISSRETLEEVLEDYKGTILFVSHDRYLIDRIANRLWVVEDEQLTAYLGNYSDFIRRRERATVAQPVSKVNDNKGKGARKPEPSYDGTARVSERDRRQVQQELAISSG